MAIRMQPVRALPVAAASGIARVGTRLFVVADDDHRLVTFELGDAAGRRR